MKWKVGDLLRSPPRGGINPTTGRRYETVLREIVEVRPGRGYTWRYPNDGPTCPNGQPNKFYSEDSNDQFLLWGWEAAPKQGGGGPMTDEWHTGWPHDADLFAKVEVEYRDGWRETAEVCEINWSRPDDNDMYSPLPEREVVRYRMLPS